MTLARAADPPPPRADVRRRAARAALVELQRLVRVLERHAPVGAADPARDLAVLEEDCRIGQGEPHLRAVSALLVTLASYQLQRGARRGAGGDGAAATRADATADDVPARSAPSANGTPANGTAILAGGDAELAAAAARYIARDLAARQLSEFTSAEGYRLARALGRLGRVEAQVERLLTEANKVRLHPMPLIDALSHSPH